MKKRSVLLVLLTTLAFCSAWASAGAGEERAVRQAAQHVFEDLKQKRYESLYDALPQSSQKRVNKERFISALTNAEGMYRLDRLEIGTVRVSGDFAVADTTMYGHIYKPIESEGKIVAQQYLVKENGSWKVATGDRGLIQKFLAENPEFARKFPMHPSRVLINRDGKWIDVTALRQRRPNS